MSALFTLRRSLLRLTRLPQQALVLLVKGYRLLLSPWLGSSCRFEPTCSAYSLQEHCKSTSSSVAQSLGFLCFLPCLQEDVSLVH